MNAVTRIASCVLFTLSLACGTTFTGELMDVDVLEIIRTWRFEPGDRVSSL